MSAPAEKIGPYEVLREIGRGGMGVVSLARDSRLDRDVAIKALPEELASDPVRLERFEREAKTLAGLNHPNIAGIYGVEEQDGQRYLILEYVQGGTLGERLDRGPLPVDEAMELAIEIAKGVEAAHEAGVIHRDLKPDNIKITPDGHVKVLDFGLAKAEELSSSATNNADSPTLTTPHSPTIPGAILGTAAYMSPEQARGRKVDKRADIWAFGVILYEMLTGASPFAGESASDSIGAVLHKSVELNRLPPAAPPGLARLLERCLERDKNQRYRDIGDVRIELEGAVRSEGRLDTKRPSRPASILAVLGWIVALGAVVTIVGGVWSGTRHPAPTVRSTVLAPDGFTIETFEISPDGSQVAMVVEPAQIGREPGPRRTRLFVRDLASEEMVEVEGGDGVFAHRYSPDGDTIAFLTRGAESAEHERLMRVPSDLSTAAVEVMRVPDLVRAGSEQPTFCWSPRGEIVFMNPSVPSLSIHDPGAGRLIREVSINTDLAFPDFGVLGGPFGDHQVTVNPSRFTESGFIFDCGLIDLETGTLTVVAENAADLARLDDERVLFTRSDSIYVSPFDAKTRTLTGSFRPVQRGLGTGSFWDHGSYSLSNNGTLLYLGGGVQGETRQLVIVQRDGEEQPWFDEHRAFEEDVAISSDGARLATLIGNPGGLFELWVSEVDRPRLRRLHAEPGGDVYEPVFTPDGEHIVTTCWSPRAQEPGRIMVFRFDGSEPPRRIWGGWSKDDWVVPRSVSSDGRRVLVIQHVGGTSRLLELDIAGDAEPRLLVEQAAIFDPDYPPNDVPLVCYVSTETGRPEAFVREIGEDGVGPAIPVTTRGTWDSAFVLDDELGLCVLHFDLEWRQHITPITYENGRIQVGDSSATGQLGNIRYEDRSYTRDGRSLAIKLGEDEMPPTQLRLVQNWLAEFGQ